MALRYNKRYIKSIRGELENLGIGFDMDDVRSIISDLKYLRANGTYDEFFDTFKKWKEPINISTSMHKELQSISPLLSRAISNNLIPERGNIFSGSIDYFSFYHFYRLLQLVYSMNLGRPLQEEDVKAIFSSDILEKIILEQENFDRVHSTEDFNDTFFYYINEVEWTDRHTETFFDRLHDLLSSKSFDEIGNREISFKRELKRMVKFLAVCNTVNKGKTYITTIEVISAYKTLFKVIGADITNLVNKKEYNGLLICPMCNGYYNLEEDETPDDFTHCSCGGELVYTMSLEDVKNYRSAFKELILDKKSLIAGIITSLTFAIIFNNVLLIALLSGIITSIMAKNYTNNFKYGFLTGHISGSLFYIAVFIFGVLLSGIELNHLPSTDGSAVFIFILVLGVFTIYCGRIGTFMVKKPKNSPIIPV